MNETLSERGEVRVPNGPTIEWDVVPEGCGWLYGVWVDCKSEGMIVEGYRSRRRDALRVAKQIAAVAESRRYGPHCEGGRT